MLSGVIVEYHREYCWIKLDADGREVVAKPRSRLEIEQQREEKDYAKEGKALLAQQVSVGDRVVVDEHEPGQFVIEQYLERETWLMRKGTKRYRRRFQLVVANADQLAVVIATVPELNLNVVDRYFLAAIQGGLEPLLIVNKIDLAPDIVGSVEVRNYTGLGYRAFFTSAKQGEGLASLADALAGKFTAFCGQSGVGKSTILSQLTGVDIRIGEVRKTHSGRQTTTTSRMYELPGGGQVVDTPGVRVFGLAHLTWLDVHEYFSDIAALTSECAYRNCNHTVEPDCRVLQAVEAGDLSRRRLESYVKLRGESDTKTWEGEIE